ncbi:MAG: hypothetical protein K5695_11055 [Oscillospiraceae bacterium]|nr:hypothetical protein [Oscillospiraceae bacterium]
MMQEISMDLLTDVDDAALERIAREYPMQADEALFERAYQGYLEESGCGKAPKPGAKRHWIQVISVAACCLLIVGAACLWRIPPHPLPTLPEITEPPSETGTVSITTEASAETETHDAASTSPTEQPTPDPTEPTISQTEPPTQPDTQATVPAETSPVTQAPVVPTETVPAPKSTEPVPTEPPPTEPEPSNPSLIVPSEPHPTEPPLIEPPPTKPYLTGDINGDREISIRDIVTLHDHLTSVSLLDDEQLQRADINEDHCVDANDLALLKQTVLRTIEEPRIEKPYREVLQQTLGKWDITDDGILYAKEDCDGVFDLTIPNGGFCDRSELLQAMLQAYPDGIFAVELKVYPADDSYSYEAEQAYLQEQGITMQVAYQGAYELGYAILRADQIEFFLPYQHAGYNMSLAIGAYLNIP